MSYDALIAINEFAVDQTQSGDRALARAGSEQAYIELFRLSTESISPPVSRDEGRAPARARPARRGARRRPARPRAHRETGGARAPLSPAPDTRANGRAASRAPADPVPTPWERRPRFCGTNTALTGAGWTPRQLWRTQTYLYVTPVRSSSSARSRASPRVREIGARCPFFRYNASGGGGTGRSQRDLARRGRRDVRGPRQVRLSACTSLPLHCWNHPRYRADEDRGFARLRRRRSRTAGRWSRTTALSRLGHPPRSPPGRSRERRRVLRRHPDELSRYLRAAPAIAAHFAPLIGRFAVRGRVRSRYLGRRLRPGAVPALLAP